MSGLDLISIVIGLVLVYSLLSIIVTTINTLVGYLVNTRGRYLKTAFKKIFKDDPQDNKDNVAIAKERAAAAKQEAEAKQAARQTAMQAAEDAQAIADEAHKKTAQAGLDAQTAGDAAQAAVDSSAQAAADTAAQRARDLHTQAAQTAQIAEQTANNRKYEANKATDDAKAAADAQAEADAEFIKVSPRQYGKKFLAHPLISISTEADDFDGFWKQTKAFVQNNTKAFQWIWQKIRFDLIRKSFNIVFFVVIEAIWLRLLIPVVNRLNPSSSLLTILFLVVVLLFIVAEMVYFFLVYLSSRKYVVSQVKLVLQFWFECQNHKLEGTVVGALVIGIPISIVLTSLPFISMTAHIMQIGALPWILGLTIGLSVGFLFSSMQELFGTSRVEWITKEVFTTVLLDLEKSSDDPDAKKQNFNQFMRALTFVPPQKAETGAEGAVGDAPDVDVDDQLKFDDKTQKNISDWFNQVSLNITRDYRLKQNVFAFFVGFLLAFLLNVDTVQIVQTLISQPQQQQVLEVAKSILQLTPSPDSKPSTIASCLDTTVLTQAPDATPVPGATLQPGEVANTVCAIEDVLNLNLPISWSYTDCRIPDATGQLPVDCKSARNLWMFIPEFNKQDLGGFILRKAIGLIITAIALAQGAPFWFALLNQVIRGRTDATPTANQTPPPPNG